MNPKNLYQHIGNLRQIGGIRRVRATEGVEAGLELIQLRCGDLEFEVLPQRGLDIGAAYFRGHSLAWLSHAGFASPSLAEEKQVVGWLRAFGGGLLTTCGLQNVGKPCVDEGIEYGQHGRASSTPAFEVLAYGEWQGEDYGLSVQGKTREAMIYGHKLEKTRRIQSWLGRGRIEITDIVENIGSKPAPLMILYHFNLGWPLLQAGTRIAASSQSLEVIEGSAEGWNLVSAPTADWVSSVLEHHMQPAADGWVRTRAVGAGIQLELAYDTTTLPRFTQWRQLGLGDYVMGLEPGNVGVRGRVWERENGTLPVLEAGESRVFRLTVEVSSV